MTKRPMSVVAAACWLATGFFQPLATKAQEVAERAAEAQRPSISLAEVLDAARAHYPRLGEHQLRERIASRRLENLDQRFRPQFELGGTAAYHSEVPELAPALGGGPARDQYSVHVDVSQRLWDSGRTQSERKLEVAGAAVDRAAIEIDFHGWHERLEQAYFGVLAADAERRLQQVAIDDLEIQRRLADARVRAGVSLAGDRAAIEAEIEVRRQRLDQLAAEREGAVALLAALSGLELEAGVELARPTVPTPGELAAIATAAATGEGVARAEIDAARGTQRLLQARYEASGLATKPVVSAFAQAGVGRPADQNFFERDLTPYVVAGVRFAWQPFDWGVTRREQDIRTLEREVSRVRLETFLTSLSASLAQLAARIEATQAVLSADQRILALRTEVAQQSEAQLRAGVITASSYLIDRNAEFRAALAHELHQLDLTRDLVAFSTTLGVSFDDQLSPNQ